MRRLLTRFTKLFHKIFSVRGKAKLSAMDLPAGAQEDSEMADPSELETNEAINLPAPTPVLMFPRELRDHIYDDMLANSYSGPLKFKQKSKPQAIQEDVREATADLDNDDSASEASTTTPERERHVQLKSHVRHYATPQPPAERVNQIWEQEYLERAEKHMTLVIQDSETYSFQKFVVPDQFTTIHHVELHLILFCHTCPYMSHQGERTCQAANEVNRHMGWIKDVLPQFTDLQSLTIRAYLCHQCIGMDSKQPSACETIATKKVEDFLTLKDGEDGKHGYPLKSLVLYTHNYLAKQDFSGTKKCLMAWPQSLQDEIMEAEKEKKKEKDVAVTDAEEDVEMTDEKTTEQQEPSSDSNMPSIDSDTASTGSDTVSPGSNTPPPDPYIASLNSSISA